MDGNEYERVLTELREWTASNIIGARPLGAAALISIQENMRKLIADRYDVPIEWVTLLDVHFSDDRRSIVCEGFHIWPGGLENID